MRWILLAALVGCGDNVHPVCSWSQWGRTGDHGGQTCAIGQPLERAVVELVYDPFTPQEEDDADGELVIHYQTPLIDGDDMFMLQKGGTYTPCVVVDDQRTCDPHRLETQVWSEQRYHWNGDSLDLVWSFASDWVPEPGVHFEPMFQPALAGDRVAIPGKAGSLQLVDRESGAMIDRIVPPRADDHTYVAGGITAAPDGTLYYNTLTLDPDAPFQVDAASALVVVAPDGGVRTVDYATLIPAAPAPGDMCEGQFDFSMLPLPPPPNPDGTAVLPAPHLCGSQRAGINETPALGPDGQIFVATRAHFDGRYSFVVAIARDLTLAWATSLRGILHDGCGVAIPIDGTDTENLFDCRVGATIGVDPLTNTPPAGIVDDDSSSSPVALPDGGVLYGALTLYNAERGHLLRFTADGAPVATYDFGWDTTPSVIPSANGFEVVVKDNHYGVDENGVDLGPFYLVHLDEQLSPIWKFESTETQSCVRADDGTVQCVEDHPHGFEWCINAPAVDGSGVTYANSEDGHLYAITADGQLRDRFFLDRAEGAAYTPVALDQHGRVYAMNNGKLTVVGAN